MMKHIGFVAICAFALALPARADQLSVFRNTLDDVAARSRAFSSRARTELTGSGTNRSTVKAAGSDLSRASQALQSHLAAKQADQFSSDLEIISNARDAVDSALPQAGASPRLKSDWRALREATDTMLQLASGDQGGGGAEVTPGTPDDEAPPARHGAPAGAPRITRVNLVGPDELHLAAADLAAILDGLSGQIQRYGRLDRTRRAALDALGAMRAHCDALAGAPGLDDIRPEAQRFTSLINSVDRTLPNLGDYASRRPLWQEARKLALGILKHTK